MYNLSMVPCDVKTSGPVQVGWLCVSALSLPSWGSSVEYRWRALCQIVDRVSLSLRLAPGVILIDLISESSVLISDKSNAFLMAPWKSAAVCKVFESLCSLDSSFLACFSQLFLVVSMNLEDHWWKLLCGEIVEVRSGRDLFSSPIPNADPGLFFW